MGEGTEGVTRRQVLGGIAGVAGTTAASGLIDARRLVPDMDAQPRPRRHDRKGHVREYWIQAESYRTNVVPTGRDDMTGDTYDPSHTTFEALRYRAYTPGWEAPLPANGRLGPNDGVPGPILRGYVGDTIRVQFRNADQAYSQPHSIHAHGVRYEPLSDGAWTWVDENKPGTAVQPGETYTYTFQVHPESVGTWVYHDHSRPFGIDGRPPVMELGAELGLMGMFVLEERDAVRPDREIYLVMHDIDSDNIPGLAHDFDLMNGFAFLGNTPTFTARVGEHVRWHVMALGTPFHVFHVHGHRFRVGDAFTDAVVVGPSTTFVADYMEKDPGEWLYHCHVVGHMMGGMVGNYVVERG